MPGNKFWPCGTTPILPVTGPVLIEMKSSSTFALCERLRWLLPFQHHITRELVLRFQLPWLRAFVNRIKDTSIPAMWLLHTAQPAAPCPCAPLDNECEILMVGVWAVGMISVLFELRLTSATCTMCILVSACNCGEYWLVLCFHFF